MTLFETTFIETIPPMRRTPAPSEYRRDRSDDYAWRNRRAGNIRTGPAPSRPGGGPLRYRGSGAVISRASHCRRPAAPATAATMATTVGLALMAALITGWLGLVAQFGGFAAGQPAAVPDQLGVVQVQDGESLAQLAARVAPDAPSGPVVARIRELNRLDSAALDAGQTLIAPIG